MYRIRFHGRGGQGMKTASRILGTAFFLQGYQVQDATRYGAERRGAPIFAYVRASREAAIHERGIIRAPDLVLVADDSLLPVPLAGVLQGAGARTVMLVHSRTDATTWQHRLHFPGTLLTLAPGSGARADMRFVGALCAGAAARLLGVIARDTLAQALRDELAPLGDELVRRNLAHALTAFDQMAPHAGCVREGGVRGMADVPVPDWVELPLDAADAAAAAIHAGGTSVQVRTGVWRSVRPVIDYARCQHCWWVCSAFCPDSAIAVVEGKPVIDYDHCKGCMICVAQCPPHAIAAVAEHKFAEAAA